MWRTWIQQDWGPYKKRWGASLQVPQWLELCVVSATGAGSVPGQRTKIPHAVQRGKKKVNTAFDGEKIFFKKRKKMNPLQYSCPGNPMDKEAW